MFITRRHYDYRQILHVDLDAFLVAVERVVDPGLCGRPVVVAPGGLGAPRAVVASASYEARAEGVRPGMPLVQARRLSPGIAVLAGNPDLYERASRAVFALARPYAPLFEISGMEEVYLDITGTRRLFGAAADLGVKLAREIHSRLRLDATVGLATSKLVARVAVGVAKPSGFLDVIPGHEADFLAPLKVWRLPGVGGETEKRLLVLNVRRIGEIASLPAQWMEAAFGRAGAVLHERARGIDPSPVEERNRLAAAIARGETLSTDTNDATVLGSVLFGLVENTAAELRRQGLAARGVEVRVRCSDSIESARSANLQEPSDLDMELYGAAARLLSELMDRRTTVRRVGVSLKRLIGGFRQMSLFGPEENERARLKSLMTAVDTIRTRHGSDAIRFARAVA